MQLRELEDETQIARRKFAGLSQRRDCLGLVVEVGQHVRQGLELAGITPRALGDRLPGCQGLGPTVQAVQVFSQVDPLVRRLGRDLDGLPIKCQGLLDHAGLPEEVGDCFGGHRVASPAWTRQ